MAAFSSLRVLLVAKPWRGGFASYVFAALREVVGGGNVTFVPTRPMTLVDRAWARLHAPCWRDHVLRSISQATYDLALFITPPAYVAEIARPEKHAIWLVDDAHITPAMAATMGHIFLSDPGYEAELRAAIPAQHFAGVLPFAMLPSLHAPSVHTAPAHRPLCFIANRDTKRDQWLADLLRNRIDCHVYGNYFPTHPLVWRHPMHFHPAIPLTGMQAVYAQYRLSLNIHAAIVRAGTNMRSFEAAGYGIPQLIEYRPGIETLFDLDTEIACFRTVEELRERAQRLLKNREGAAALATRAQARVFAEHTYQHRVETILARVM
jgi:hypothetical protein